MCQEIVQGMEYLSAKKNWSIGTWLQETACKEYLTIISTTQFCMTIIKILELAINLYCYISNWKKLMQSL